MADLASEAPSVGSLIDDWFAANLPGLFHLHDLDLDPDQDGVDNGGELVLSGNPLARDGALVSLTVSENLMSELEFLMRSDVPGVGIDVWFSNDLVHWFPAGARIGNVQDNPSSDPSYMRRTMDFSPMPDDETSRMFFRIDQTDLNLY